MFSHNVDILDVLLWDFDNGDTPQNARIVEEVEIADVREGAFGSAGQLNSRICRANTRNTLITVQFPITFG